MLTFITLLLLLIAALAFYSLHWKRHPINPKDYPWLTKAPALDDPARGAWLEQTTEQLLDKMNLKEQQAQLSGDGGVMFLVRLGVNVLWLGRFPNHYAGRNSRLKIPPLSFTDGPRGIVVGRSTCFPVALARAASWNTALEQQVGDCLAKEARVIGANYFAGLCINLLRHPAWGRAQECYGEDPVLTARFGCALIDGLEKHNVMACAKHFAANNIENSRFYVDVNMDQRTLHEVYLPHFKAVVDHGAASLMSAYNKLDGEYCGHSKALLQDILREQWGFEGFVSSDWLWGVYNAEAGTNAGMDVEMPIARQYGYKLGRAIKQGAVKPETIRRNAKRVIKTKLDYISRPDPQDYPDTLLACDQHQQLAQIAAEQSMVLLKNKSDPTNQPPADQTNTALLPLNKNKQQNILLVGELADADNQGDHGSSWVSPPEVCRLKQGLEQYLKNTDCSLQYNPGNTPAHLEKLEQQAQQADTVIVVAGYRFDEEGENLKSNHTPPSAGGKSKVAIGGDRASLTLSSQHQQLIKTTAKSNSNTVVCLVGGSAIITHPWDHQVNSILMCWYPGMRGGQALARILFGEVNPSGHLPFSVPFEDTDLVAFDAFAEHADYQYHHGYTLFDQQNKKAAYPFGFGLSYTQFSYSDIQLESDNNQQLIRVSCKVENKGERAGETVAQCYVGFESVAQQSGIERHPKLLRDFQKIQLQPGDSQRVEFQLQQRQLTRYEPESKQWILDSGSYAFMIGDNAESAEKLQLSHTIPASE